jgi:hypothetical protein
MGIQEWRVLPSFGSMTSARLGYAHLQAAAPPFFRTLAWNFCRRPKAFAGPPKKIERRELTQHQVLSSGPFEVPRAAEAVGLTAPGDPG